MGLVGLFVGLLVGWIVGRNDRLDSLEDNEETVPHEDGSDDDGASHADNSTVRLGR
jgi:hypothetical protein